MDHPAAHRDRVTQHLVRNPELLECVNAARGEREIDRAAADEVAGVRIWTALEELDFMAASAEESGHHSAGEAAADQREFAQAATILPISHGGKQQNLRRGGSGIASASVLGTRMDFETTVDKDGRAINRMELKSILLVDDDKQLASALQWILADENYLVDVAYDGEEAMQKVLADNYDAVVCDLMMPRLRGDELYFRATQVRPALADRFIFITGFAAEPRINAFLTSHDVKYLMKPFPVEGLIDCVKELLGCFTSE